MRWKSRSGKGRRELLVVATLFIAAVAGPVTPWASGGRPCSAQAVAQWQPRATMADGRITLTWQPPADLRIKGLRVYRSATPGDTRGTPVAELRADAREYSEKVANWTPYYFWIEAINSKGEPVATSNKVAAFAHPAETGSGRAETFAFWYQPYRNTAAPDASVRHIGKAAFVVTDRAEAVADLPTAGMGSLSYLTLYQTHLWTDPVSKNDPRSAVAEKIAPIAFYQPSAEFPGSPPGYVPSQFSRPGNIEYNSQAIQYTTCPNSTTFRDQVLSFVHSKLAAGARGIFVDNGYDDDIAAGSVCQSTRHSHYYGNDLTSADAFVGILLEIRCAVKRHDPGGIVMVNGGVPARTEYYGLTLDEVSDGELWESYLRTAYPTPRDHAVDWDTVYQKSVDREKAWQAATPRRTYVLSYPWNRDEAFFCYATAKLCNLPWAAGLGADPQQANTATYPELVGLRLGLPADPRQLGAEKLGEIYLRRYQRGWVAVNPTRQALSFALPEGRPCRDVYAGIDLPGGKATLPPQSGRVYLYR